MTKLLHYFYFFLPYAYMYNIKKEWKKRRRSNFWTVKWMTRRIKTDRLSVKHHLVTHRCSLSEASTHQHGLFYDPFVWKASLRVFHSSTDQISIGLSLKQRCWHCYSRPLWSLMIFFSFWLMMLMMILIEFFPVRAWGSISFHVEALRQEGLSQSLGHNPR